MSAANWDFVVEEGSDFQFSFIWFDPSCTTRDVTGYGAKLQMREKIDFPLLWTISTANSRITVTGVSGKFDIFLPAASTSAPGHPFSKGVWDLKVWPTAASPDVNPLRLMEGKVRYREQVTE